MARAYTDEQRIAIETLDRPFGLLAAAGSGKTTVLVQRYLRHLSEGLKPHELLTVTFTNEAAEQMRERVVAELERAEAAAPLRESVDGTRYIGTLHGFCFGLVDQYGSALGLPPVKGIVSAFEHAHQFDTAYRGWLETLGDDALRRLMGFFSPYELRPLFKAIVEARFTLDAALRHLPRASAEEQAIWPWLRALASPLLAALDTRRRADGHYAFDELEHLALRILDEAEGVAARLRKQFRAVLVDEFQDTSLAQWEIVRRLLPEDRGRLFVVGDPKQSIYRFRHADYRLFLSVLGELGAGRGEVRELSVNFRSRPALVGAVNALSERLFEGTDVPFAPMRSGRDADDALPLCVRRYAAGERRQESAVAERAVLVTAVRERLEAGAAPADIALLFRVSDQIPAFATALAEAGIAAAAKRTTRLFEHYDVLDIAAFLRTALNPLDDFHLAAFLRSSFVRKSECELLELTRRPGSSLLEKLLGAAPAELRWLFDWLESGPVDLDGALTALFRHSPYYPMTTEAWRELLGPLYAEPLTLTDAVARLDAWEKEEILLSTETGDTGEGVRLMTVHGAKGLEFAHVFLVDLLRQPNRRTPPIRLDPQAPPGLRYRVDGETVASPSYEALTEAHGKEEAEEARRILYVALTRARESLTLLLPDVAAPAPKHSWAAWLEAALAPT